LALVAAPIAAQETDLFMDRRLNLEPDAPVIVFCRFDGGLEVFAAVGGTAIDVSRVQIEGAIAQAVLDETQIQVAAGIAGARLIVYPDGNVVLFAQNYQFTVPGTACGGYRPDYTAVVRLVDDLIDFVGAEVDSNGELVPAEDSDSHYYGSGHTRHIVRSGENLYRIGLRYGVPYTEIARVNGITDVTRIYAGQVLIIP
jgi:nucleoid-associated protein YgaU